LLAIAARNGWAVDNFDFDSTYLNSKLDDDEVVYVEQPPDHEYKDRGEWVLRLVEALYGLKQGAKNWYDALIGHYSSWDLRGQKPTMVFSTEKLGKTSLFLQCTLTTGW
jgi:hypothetical protein